MYAKYTKHVLFYAICYAILLNNLTLTYERQSVLMSQEELVRLTHEQDNDEIGCNVATTEEMIQLRAINPKKAMTLIIYIAADNDLHPFAWKNIKQMESIGSSENINVLVQINTPGYTNPTKRYVIKKGKRLLVPADGNALTQKLNSGSPQTLIDCAAWAMQYYPADNLVINLWNHGSGIYDPMRARIVNPSDLFRLNEATNELELDRTIGYTDLMDSEFENYNEERRQNGRGICFDETFKSFISTHDLAFALREIQNNVLDGQKISAIWFDACLMAMLEVASACKEHVEYFIASQEVEFASGSNYELVLRPFLDRTLTPREFACHIVDSYAQAYQYITRDFTQSVMDLSSISNLENNVHHVAGQLLTALQHQNKNSVTKLLQKCKTWPTCTCFEEPTYIDLRHFYMNLQANLNLLLLNDAHQQSTVRYNLTRLLDQGINLINKTVIANKTGSNLPQACGISIYFPERGMFPSYPKSSFASKNNWGLMVQQYLLSKK